MRSNSPVTQKEHQLKEDATLMSTTDTASHITYANSAFIEASGFTEEALLAQPHNIIRHPDMPPEAFADMWFTLQRGDTWTGIVKNRRFNGDHYWVRANVTPVFHNDELTGYISVRNVPLQDEIASADALYQKTREKKLKGMRLYKGLLIRRGPLAMLSALRWLPVSWQIGGATMLTLALALILMCAQLPALWFSAGLVVLLGLLNVFIQRQICQPLKVILAQAQKIVSGRKGDYCHFNRVDEVGMVMRLINQSGLNLRSLVDDVSTQISGISTICQNMTEESVALRQRSEETATHLQQTAAVVEEIADAVRHTADTAAQAAVMAGETSDAARNGGEMMAKTIDTMQSVARGSQQIVDIIRVIDSIAFQTNILALNAAVEAAKAGDAGRGFSVVAAEVRNLAQHAASAAKEINQLIQKSVSDTEAGVAMVEQTGRFLTTMTDDFIKMSTMIQDIGKAAQEQTTSLEQINESVANIGTMTDNNAVMVERITQAADELNSRSHRLSQAVAVFGG